MIHHNATTFNSFDYNWQYIVILLAVIFSLIWAFYHWYRIVNHEHFEYQYYKQDSAHGYTLEIVTIVFGCISQFYCRLRIANLIMVILIFLCIFGFIDKFKIPFISVTFLIGNITTFQYGYFGLRIFKNIYYRILVKAQSSFTDAFNETYCTGMIISFIVSGISSILLFLLLIIEKQWIKKDDLFSTALAFAFGSLSASLITRITGGLYSKSSDIAIDNVSKIQRKSKQDTQLAQQFLFDLVGDSVGNISGIISELTSFYVCSISITLYIGSKTLIKNGLNLQFDELLLLPFFNCALCNIINIGVSSIPRFFDADNMNTSELLLHLQIIIGAGLELLIIGISSYFFSPATFDLDSSLKSLNVPTAIFICQMMGVVVAIILAYYYHYIININQMDQKGLARHTKSGIAFIVIDGLSQGMLSIIVPAILMMIIFYFSHMILGFYGIALTGLGIIYNLPLLMSCSLFGSHIDFILGFTIKKFQQKKFQNLHNNFPPSYTHNIQHINRLKQLALNGKVISKVAKGYSIILTTLLSLSLYYYYISKIQILEKVGLKNPLILIGLIIGSILPYFIAAFLKYGVVKLAVELISTLRLNKQPISIEYQDLQDPRMNKSIYFMILPLLISLIIPIIMTILLGGSILIGIIPGVMITGFILGISQWNSGSSWSMANTFIQSQKILAHNGNLVDYKEEEKNNSVIADLIGDPMKDLIGPTLLLIIIVIPVEMLLFAEIITKINL